MTTLVTGAAGKTGMAILAALREGSLETRALVRREGQRNLVRSGGAGEAVVADLRDRGALRRAIRGCRRIYHICPNFCADEVEIAEILIDLAREQEIEHLAFHSVLHPQVEAMSHHWRKMRVEERLFESGLRFTILQPSAYLQNLVPYWRSAQRSGELTIPYSTEQPISMVDLRDVASVAAQVLADPEAHGFAAYELSGSAVSHVRVAEIFSKVLGRPVSARCVPLDQWRQKALEGGLGEAQCAELEAMFRYYDHHGFAGSPWVLTALLGRRPRTLEAFVRELPG